MPTPGITHHTETAQINEDLWKLYQIKYKRHLNQFLITQR